MLLAEDLLLLVTDDTSGRLSAPAAQVDAGLGGANLIELTLMNKVDLSGEGDQGKPGRIIVRDPSPVGEGEIAALRRPDGKVRWRDRGAFKEAQSRLDASRPEYERLHAAAVEARRIANAFRRDTKAAIADLSASAALSRDEIKSRDTAATQAETRVRELEQAQFATLNQLTELRAVQAAAVAAEELITTCTQRGWPDMNIQARALRVEITQDNARRRTVEQRHAELQEQYEKLARDAQGEIIRTARLVATTLARFRTVKAVLEGPYDVVLIDEVGAATLPEVLLAVAKASQCAVLLGDFMQLGPILPRTLQDSDRTDIQRWLVTDPFRHCGITTLAEATSRPACLVLDTQHRFGPNVMRLANLVAYDGLLKAGGAVRSHVDNDPEIVLVDTDGLHELAVAGPGTVGVLPRRLRHAYVVTSATARFLTLHTPAGFEQFAAEAGEPARALTLPPPPAGPPDFAALAQAAARHQITILAPPPQP